MICSNCGRDETCPMGAPPSQHVPRTADVLDCERARSVRLKDIADALAADLEEALTYVPEYFRDKHQIGAESIANWRAMTSVPAPHKESP